MIESRDMRGDTVIVQERTHALVVRRQNEAIVVPHWLCPPEIDAFWTSEHAMFQDSAEILNGCRSELCIIANHHLKASNEQSKCGQVVKGDIAIADSQQIEELKECYGVQ